MGTNEIRIDERNVYKGMERGSLSMRSWLLG